jgi:Tfp pilus assembly protein PilV
MQGISYRKRTTKGVTLIEVMFACFLALMSALILSAAMPISTVSREKANMQDLATSIAQRQLESVKSVGFGQITPSRLTTLGLIDSATPVSTNTYSFNNNSAAIKDNPASVLPSGSGTVTINSPNLDLKEIIVTVAYKDRGTNKSVKVGTNVANF